MKKSCLFAIFLVLVGFSVNAEEVANEAGDGNGHFFSFGFSFGMLSGASEEIIYRSSSANSYRSQLIWQINPLLYAGVDLGYGWRGPANPRGFFQNVFSGFFVNASFKYGLPADTGLMEDMDWLADDPNWLTDYSFHNNRTYTAMLAGLDIGKSFRLYNQFRLSIFFSYNAMYYSFVATGGTWLYPEPDGGHFYNPGSDNVITYRQFWQILSPGLSFYGVFNSYFGIELFFKATPLIAAASFDKHLLRDLQIINDPMYFGLYIEPGFVFTFKPPTSKLMLSLSLNYRNISGTRGNLLWRYPYESITYRNTGGAGYSAFDIGLTAKLRFGG
ncbi:MAG: omptin family outer membrane protease [Treponema sp.]|nr:omptin family outer membrane protease [Treponema sp.]